MFLKIIIPLTSQLLESWYLFIAGALYIRSLNSLSSAPLHPMLFGGGQERNLRPGTENTGMIAGLGKAAELVVEHLEEYNMHMLKV